MINVLIRLLDILIPIGLCVVLPILVVWIAMRFQSHKVDKTYELLVKMLENGQEVDPELLAKKSSNPSEKSIKMKLLQKLQVAGVFSLLGITLIILSVTGVMRDNAGVGFPVFLLCGIIFASIGLGNLLSWYVGSRTLKKEMEAELEKARLENIEKANELK
ncbi:MAG: DUF6249 domain-containing protein [Candidatus Cryptobacteroides sp.]